MRLTKLAFALSSFFIAAHAVALDFPVISQGFWLVVMNCFGLPLF